jgi:hypothetical protein
MRKVKIIEGKFADKGYSQCFDYMKEVIKQKKKQKVKNNDSSLRKG